MYHFRAKAGYYDIEGQRTWCASQTEAIILRGLIKQGFGGLWAKPQIGQAHGTNQYTPDAELQVMWDELPKRVWVEFKDRQATQFKKDRRAAARVALKCNTEDETLLLYVYKTKRWYEVMRDLSLRRIPMPAPATTPVPKRDFKFSYTATTYYGNMYRREFVIDMMRKLIDWTQTALQGLLFSQPNPRRHRKK